MTTDNLILTVSELRKTFTLHAVGRTVTSLDGVSLEVRRGEHVAVAGSSGAGKSSLLRCIYRNYLPDSGKVTLHSGGEDLELTALSDRAMARVRGHRIGYVSQFLNAPPRTGPLEFATAAATRRGHNPDEARELAAASLRGVNIDERLWDIDCSVLSGGERQRVNLAAGIVSPPDLLLLDEPVSALDPANREHALEMIDDLANNNVAVIGVYHDMNIIRRLANRVLVMGSGQIIADDVPEKALAKHADVLGEAFDD